jgi:hypothetical protein
MTCVGDRGLFADLRDLQQHFSERLPASCAGVAHVVGSGGFQRLSRGGPAEHPVRMLDRNHSGVSTARECRVPSGGRRLERYSDAWRQLLCKERVLGDFVGPNLE